MDMLRAGQCTETAILAILASCPQICFFLAAVPDSCQEWSAVIGHFDLLL